MPSAHAHMDRHDEAVTDDPILLADIDRILQDSAPAALAGARAPIRRWRDELASALESLAYARTVLAADVGILRHRLSTGPGGDGTLVDDLSHAMSRPWGKGWSAPRGREGGAAVDWGIFARSDHLMSTHQDMARVDLSSRHEVSHVLVGMEAQLAELADREEAVEERLRELRAAIVRQYEEGGVSPEDWLT